MSEPVSNALEDRVELFPKPTPLVHLENISTEIGVDIHVKRDDLTAVGGGGNKARKLEFIGHEALQSDADTLVTIGSVQSNHARMTAAVASRLGLDSHLLLIVDGDDGTDIEGNRLLETILGADITYTTATDASDDIDAVLEELEADGDDPYFIEGGGHTPTGALGYLQCVTEIESQHDGEIDYVVTATGTGTTHAGLVAGTQRHNPSTEVLGISVSRSEQRCVREIDDTLAALDERFSDLNPTDAEVTVFDRYVGEDGYGTVTPEACAAIRRVARAEAMFLDPVYTGKTFGGLLDLVEDGYVERGSTVVFLHTGGLPGLFVSRFENREIWET